MKLYLIISVDTETDIIHGNVIPVSKMIYGEVNGEHYGIRRIMDYCEARGFKATFFVSTFECEVVAESVMRKVCREIYERGHDVQLHTHPKWVTRNSFMWKHSAEKQRELIEIGKERIKRWTGEYPIAHRGGGFGSSEDTLKALRWSNIPVDSSFIDGPYCKLSKVFAGRNMVQISNEGIVELPVTQFSQFKFFRFRPQKPFDINANTLDELKYLISAAKQGDMAVAVLLMHSFSFLRRNKTRSTFRANINDLKKFERFLDYIAKDKDIKVITVKEFYGKYLETPQLFKKNEVIPVSGYKRSIFRAFKYFDKGRGNKIIAFTAVGLIFCLLGFITLSILAVLV